MLNYFHYNKNRTEYGQPFTVCIDIDFTKDLLYMCLRDNLPVMLSVGKTRLHEDDLFIKSVGRETSKNKLLIHTFYIHSVQTEINKNAFYLINKEVNLVIRLHVDKNKDKPILTYAGHYE